MSSPAEPTTPQPSPAQAPARAPVFAARQPASPQLFIIIIDVVVPLPHTRRQSLIMIDTKKRLY